MADKFVPIAKQQKKLQRQENAKKRGTWYGLNPTTRRPPNPRAYNRSDFKRGGG